MSVWGVVAKAAGKVGGILTGQDKLKKQQAFEREKMKNAHQWEVADLQAAGLNPILSAGGSPNMGGTPAGDSPIWPELGNQALSAVDKILQKKKIENEKILMDAQATEAEAQAEMAKTSAKKAKTEEEIMRKQAQAEAPRLEAQEKYNKSKAGKVLGYIGMGAKDVQPATNVLGTVGGLWWGGRMLGTANAVKKSFERRGPDSIIKGTLGPAPKVNYNAPTKQNWINISPKERGHMRY